MSDVTIMKIPLFKGGRFLVMLREGGVYKALEALIPPTRKRYMMTPLSTGELEKTSSTRH
jgi:hypothetical protein